MGIKTEDFVPGFPPKEMTEGVDWLGILDAFAPSVLEEKYLNECARRNPYTTCNKSEPPFRPVGERLRLAKFCVGSYRRDLELAVQRIECEGLSPIAYKNARAALVTAIGIKGAAEVVKREYDRLGEEGRREQAEAYAAWEREWKEKDARRERISYIASQDPDFLKNLDFYGLDEADLDELDEMLEEERARYDGCSGVSVHEKVVRIRKGWKGSNGKPLTQREFAKLLDYPIVKYAEAEKTDRYGRGEPESPVEDELLEKLVMIAHANPYWLFDPDCEEYYAEDDDACDAVVYGDQPSVYAKPDVILKWITEGRPKDTDWLDGVMERKYRW